MPRLDNSSYIVIEEYHLDFDNDDPGRTPPVDLCADCWCSWLDAELEIEHPSYDDAVYHCLECGVRLTHNDNRY